MQCCGLVAPVILVGGFEDHTKTFRRINTMRNDSNCSWTTVNELNFIKGLGSFSYQGKSDTPRRKLLNLYIHSAHRRDDWGAIDKDTVINFAYNLLETER